MPKKVKNFLYQYYSTYVMPQKLVHQIALKNAQGGFILAAVVVCIGAVQFYQIYGLGFYHDSDFQCSLAHLYGISLIVWGIFSALAIIFALKHFKQHKKSKILNATIYTVFIIGVSFPFMNFFYDTLYSSTVGWCVSFLFSLGMLTVPPIIMICVLSLHLVFIFVFGFYDETYINLLIYYIATISLTISKWKNSIKSFENTENWNLALKGQDEKIIQMQTQIIAAFASLVETRDTVTGLHIRHTSMYVDLLSIQLAEDGYYSDILTPQTISLYVSAAPLHDMGKIVIPDTILNKKSQLNEKEFEIMKTHAEKGYEIIKNTLKNIERDEYIDIASKMALCHHERYDGKGYPQGLKGEEIPLCARIMSVADVFDALLSKRQYKEPLTKQQVLEIMQKDSGTKFEPCIIEALAKIQDKIV